MKNKTYTLICLLIALFSVNSRSQDYNQIDSSETKGFAKRAKIFSNLYVVISSQNWLNVPQGIRLRTSRDRSFDLFAVKNFLKNKKFNLSSGVVFSAYNINSDVKKWEFESSGQVPSANIIADSLGYNKNKLVTTYIGIPLELKFRFGFNPKKSVFLGIGAKGGILLSGYNKYESGSIKTKTKNSGNLSRVNYGLYAYLVFHNLGIFGQYGLSNLFDAVSAPDMKFWSVGIGCLI